MTGETLPWFALVLLLAVVAIVWALRLTPPRVSAVPADREVCRDEPCEMAWCRECSAHRLSALHADGSHTCLTCLTTTAGDQ
ncbi:hypothetical protein [Streptomyces sp. B15]|uniref:hypothetical protein n=1 Tax=Streptomyces sp. B15 TaxID=1537797 RepID=UPI001B35EC94|nr:hypothetical protein [Streptomyces sp. B15]MBQ1122599.1 hypothetical protein [Streptomyces sp. B15]